MGFPSQSGPGTPCRATAIWLAGLATALFVAMIAPGFAAEPALAQEVPEDADAQRGGDQPIFRRFVLSRKTPKNWQALFEVPVVLRPQSDADADIRKNIGLNYVSSFRPNNRWYFSRSLGLSKMEWIPGDPALKRVKIRTFDLTYLVNRIFANWFVVSFGLGLGVMDGLVESRQTGGFSERLEPFIPIHFGLAARIGESFQLGLKLVHFPFLRTDPVISTTRLLVGVGINY